MSESLVLDPSEEAGDRVELDITRFVGPAGPDWGDAEVTPYMAEAARGQLPVDFRIPNRIITVPLLLMQHGVTTFEEIRSAIQGKAALFQQEGGWIKRETSIGPLYADVVGASLKLGGSSSQAVDEVDPDGVLTLECIPDFYGEWITKGTGLGTGELSCLVNDVLGNYPGRMRMLMDNGTATDQRGMIWAIRCGHYSALPTAAVGYDPGSLTPLDAATVFGTAIIHSNLSTGWTPLFSTGIAGVGQMTHTGTYEVWVRAQTTSDPPPDLRLVWDVGDLALPEENPPVTMPGPDTYLIKLGQVRLDEVPLTSHPHRWGGSVQARGQTGGENVAVNRIWIVPVPDGYGELRAPRTANLPITGFSTRDEFNQSTGVLAGKTAPVGGVWAGGGGGGGTGTSGTNFTVGSGHVGRGFLIATTLPATPDTTPRVTWLPATMTSQVVQSDVAMDMTGVTLTSASGHEFSGIGARIVDANNFLYAGFILKPPSKALQVWKYVAGVGTLLFNSQMPWLGPAAWQTIKLTAATDGTWQVWSNAQGSQLTLLKTGRDTALATGGVLASGKPGLVDFAATQVLDAAGLWDNFSAYAPDPDAVMFGAQSTQLTTDGMFREDLFGLTWSRITDIVGDLPRLPPSTAEGRPVEVFVKITPGDLEAIPDLSSAAFGLLMSYRPCWMTVPGA